MWPRRVHYDQNFGGFTWYDLYVGTMQRVRLFMCLHHLVFGIKHILVLNATTVCAAK